MDLVRYFMVSGRRFCVTFHILPSSLRAMVILYANSHVISVEYDV